MSNILNEEIKKNLYGIVQENIDDYEYFHFGEFVEKPNQCGCFERNGHIRNRRKEFLHIWRTIQ